MNSYAYAKITTLHLLWAMQNLPSICTNKCTM